MAARPGASRFPDEAHPWLFLGLTVGATWLVQWIAVSLQGSLSPAPLLALTYAGALTPLVVAVGLLYARHSAALRRDFWLRLRDVRRIGAAWWAVALLLQPCLSLLAALTDRLLGGIGIALEAAATVAERPWMLLPLVVWWLLFGPLVEEPGWRGYALDGLQARRSALGASLVVGVAWVLWHLPLFFVEGTWQAEHVGMGTVRFWSYTANLLLAAIVTAWLYNNTRRSILAAIVFHFSTNAFGELFALSPRAELFGTAATFVAVLLILSAWGPATLVRNANAPPRT